MRQIWITRRGPPEVLQVRQAPDPVAAPGQVRIRVKASGVNFADLMARMGLYPDAPRLPCVPGYEVAGTVDQVAPDVTGLAIGDPAMGMVNFGGYADVVVLSAQQVLKIPSGFSFEEAAAFPLVSLTAHHMLYTIAALRPGARVLIHSAAGGVGLAAVQLARTRGCIIFGAASKTKHEFLRQQGVTHPLDSAGDVAAAARAILGADQGLDVVLDAVGGRSWRASYRLLGPCGHLIAFGFAASVPGRRLNPLRVVGEFLRIPRYSPLQLMADNKTVSGVNLAHLLQRADIMRPQLEALLKLAEAGQIRPHVDRTFPFEQAAAAHQYLHDRKAQGKVLLVP
ncbi:MAG TPA: medium chain dehydrogenase/reductase family protein [bacterium]|nr:medium chain dehydrogenase/reductase family protein [bacterium]